MKKPYFAPTAGSLEIKTESHLLSGSDTKIKIHTDESKEADPSSSLSQKREIWK